MDFGFMRFFSKNKKLVTDQPDFLTRSSSELKALVLKTGATIEMDQKTQFLIGFQGGKFLLSYKSGNNALDIIYPNFEQFDHKDIGWVNMAANSINAYYGGWNCYFRIAKDGTEENPVNMSLSYRLWLVGNEAQIVNLLKNVLTDAFTISREFTDRFHKTVDKQVDLEKLYTLHDFNNKLAFVQNQVTMGHDGQLRTEKEWESDNNVLLSSLLDLCVDAEFGKVQEMRIICGSQVETITDADAIISFNVCDYIRTNHPEKDLREFTLAVRYEFGSVNFVLSQVNGCTEKTLYYQMQYMKHTTAYVEEYAKHAPSQDTILLEVRLTTDKEDYWEAKYMIDEVRGKQEEDENNLSLQDRAILSFVDLDLSTDYYWGRKFFNEKCYFQSLRYFMKIFQGLKMVWKDLSEDQRDSYYDICYFIGFIFMELHQYDQAYYYLDSARTDNSIPHAQEYINCLCNMSDPKAIPTIQGYLKQVREIVNEEKEKPAEVLVDFHQFLLRRLAYMFIQVEAYDEAEDLLNRMVKNGDSVEFAQSELDYIKRIRAEKELKKKLAERKKSGEQ